MGSQKRTVLCHWGGSLQEVSFKVIGGNMFVADFELAEDKSRVMEGRPWLVDSSLVSLLEFDGLTPPVKMNFDKSPFWIRMYHLPLACMDKRFGLKIGASVGEVMEIDVSDDDPGWGNFLRTRVCLDITKPLPRGRILHLNNQPLWIAFKYEKLPKFCFKCGRIIHGKQGCFKVGNSKLLYAEDESQYGPWLKVSFPSKRGKNFLQKNELPREEFSGGHGNDDSQQDCLGQMINGRVLDSSVPTIVGDKGILGNEGESHVVQGSRLEMAVDCDKGGEAFDRRECYVEGKEEEMVFLLGQSSSSLINEDLDLQRKSSRLTKEELEQKSGLDEGQSTEPISGMVMEGDKVALPGKFFAAKEDSGLEASYYVENLAQKSMGQSVTAQSVMVWSGIREDNFQSSLACNEDNRCSGPQQSLQTVASQPEPYDYSEEKDNRRDVSKKRKTRRGPILDSAENERKGSEVKRKLLDGNEVDDQLVSKKGRWVTEDEVSPQIDWAEAGFQPRPQP
jgi:hypothetical protein